MSKILVVDDDKDQRVIYEAVFQEAKFDVTVAMDGQDGWEKFEREKPDFVFTGISMPRMTGFQLIEKIREKSPDMPVIIFSHLDRPEDRNLARDMKIVFMVKGHDSPRVILKRVQDILKAKK